MKQNSAVQSRFFLFVDVQGPLPEHRPELGPCHIWTNAPRSDGYGRIHVGGGKEVAAHRIAFYIANGHWPHPCCLHHCDNRLCVNPLHLYEGTNEQNMLDMVRRGRHGTAKVTLKTVLAILDALDEGQPRGSLPARFNVSAQTIYRIDSGYSFAHLGRRSRARRQCDKTTPVAKAALATTGTA